MMGDECFEEKVGSPIYVAQVSPSNRTKEGCEGGCVLVNLPSGKLQIEIQTLDGGTIANKRGCMFLQAGDEITTVRLQTSCSALQFIHRAELKMAATPPPGQRL